MKKISFFRSEKSENGLESLSFLCLRVVKAVLEQKLLVY